MDDIDRGKVFGSRRPCLIEALGMVAQPNSSAMDARVLCLFVRVFVTRDRTKQRRDVRVSWYAKAVKRGSSNQEKYHSTKSSVHHLRCMISISIACAHVRESIAKTRLLPHP